MEPPYCLPLSSLKFLGEVTNNRAKLERVGSCSEESCLVVNLALHFKARVNALFVVGTQSQFQSTSVISHTCLDLGRGVSLVLFLKWFPCPVSFDQSFNLSLSFSFLVCKMGMVNIRTNSLGCEWKCFAVSDDPYGTYLVPVSAFQL